MNPPHNRAVTFLDVGLERGCDVELAVRLIGRRAVETLIQAGMRFYAPERIAVLEENQVVSPLALGASHIDMEAFARQNLRRHFGMDDVRGIELLEERRLALPSGAVRFTTKLTVLKPRAVPLTASSSIFEG